jgi:hypothetical protein
MRFVGNWIFGISIPFFHSHSCSILLAQRISITIRIGMDHFMTFVCIIALHASMFCMLFLCSLSSHFDA